MQSKKYLTNWNQTWDLSKNLHDRILRLKILHTNSDALRLFLLTIKQYKCINIRKLGPFLFNYTKCVRNSTLEEKNHTCSSTHIMREKMLFSWKFCTAGTNFTRPPVVTVATNLNSEHKGKHMVAFVFLFHFNSILPSHVKE